jgi:hypothetical protein
MNQMLMQKWFLRQDIKNESYFRNGVFNNWNACLAEFRQKLQRVYATRNTTIPVDFQLSTPALI